MIIIIDYGLGNIRAFANVYNKLNIPVKIVSSPKDLTDVTKIILPGVGAFDQAMRQLEESGMRASLCEMVLIRKIPVIGICVGMQILAKSSEEGVLPGLGWIEGEVKKFRQPGENKNIYLPHMGWNNVIPLANNNLFKGVTMNAPFYFLHSYYFHCFRNKDVIAETDYGNSFCCALNHENIFGVQFHPEKSHTNGIQILHNFATQ